MHGKEAGGMVYGKFTFGSGFDMKMSGTGRFFVEEVDRFC